MDSDNVRVLQVLSVTFPFFALVLAGYLATRRRWLPLDAIAGLNGFVLFFALPCMLFRFGAKTPIAQMLDRHLILVYLTCAVLLTSAALALGRHWRMPWRDASLGALVTAFPNSGFMGVPLLVALLGQGAAGPVITTMMVDMVITSSLCVALAHSDGPAASFRAALGRSMRGLLGNPMPWSILLGALASYIQLSLPAPIERTVSLLAEAASPVALFTIGAVLARAHLLPQAAQSADAPVSSSNQLIQPMALALIKLVAHPLLVWILGRAAMNAGWPISTSVLQAATLTAALPSASNVSLLAERMGADTAHIARIILISTVVSFFSFPLAVQWLGGMTL